MKQNQHQAGAKNSRVRSPKQARKTAGQTLRPAREKTPPPAVRHAAKQDATEAERDRRIQLRNDSDAACDASAGLMFLLSDLYTHPMDGSLMEEGLAEVRLLTSHVEACLIRSFDACLAEPDAGQPAGLAVASVDDVLRANSALCGLLLSFLDRENRLPGGAANGLLHLSWDVQRALQARVQELETENARLREAVAAQEKTKGGAR